MLAPEREKQKKGKESSTITRNVIFHNCTMYIFPTIIVIYVIRFFTMVHNEYPLCVATIVTNLTSNCLSLVMYTMCLWCVFLVAILWNWSKRIWFSCIECRQNNSCTFPLTMKKNSTNSFPYVRNSNNTHTRTQRKRDTFVLVEKSARSVFNMHIYIYACFYACDFIMARITAQHIQFTYTTLDCLMLTMFSAFNKQCLLCRSTFAVLTK